MKTKSDKLEQLAEIEGYEDVFEMLQYATFDSVAPCICTNKDCDYTIEAEPDCEKMLCPECKTKTITSCLKLAKIL